MDDDGLERQLNIHIDPEQLAGVYANYAHVRFSDYEFTLDFYRLDHGAAEDEISGTVVSRANLTARFMGELLEAMQDAWAKWQTREGIKNLPEAPPRPD